MAVVGVDRGKGRRFLLLARTPLPLVDALAEGALHRGRCEGEGVRRSGVPPARLGRDLERCDVLQRALRLLGLGLGLRLRLGLGLGSAFGLGFGFGFGFGFGLGLGLGACLLMRSAPRRPLLCRWWAR